jgi:hypothetical protein
MTSSLARLHRTEREPEEAKAAPRLPLRRKTPVIRHITPTTHNPAPPKAPPRRRKGGGSIISSQRRILHHIDAAEEEKQRTRGITRSTRSKIPSQEHPHQLHGSFRKNTTATKKPASKKPQQHPCLRLTRAAQAPPPARSKRPTGNHQSALLATIDDGSKMGTEPESLYLKRRRQPHHNAGARDPLPVHPIYTARAQIRGPRPLPPPAASGGGRDPRPRAAGTGGNGGPPSRPFCRES